MPGRVEIVSASDDARLIRESLEAGEILPAAEGLYYWSRRREPNAV
ncbi:MAG: hypothetical protein QOG01_4260 [Pseudonocardiales bacterium]|nr:hypothetical protein [Pseudonocardiales bacterium]